MSLATHGIRAAIVLLGCASIAAFALFSGSCADPVHDARVSALGGEAAGVPAGALHRPGQPCLTCHGGDGPSQAELSVAGTVFQSAVSGSPGLAGATVTIYDATQLADGGGAPMTVVTNAAGNFFIRRPDWSPVYALHDISISFGGVANTMHTNVGRDGSCATCHFDPKSTETHGHIYLVLEPGDFPKVVP